MSSSILFPKIDLLYCFSCYYELLYNILSKKYYLNYFYYKKAPKETLGSLTLTILLFINYSTTVATRPEPTVRPPSRYLNSVFCGIFYAFYCGKQRKIVVFVWRIFICLISWHRFGTKPTILLIYFIYMVLAPCRNIYKEKLFALTISKAINNEGIFIIANV